MLLSSLHTRHVTAHTSFSRPPHRLQDLQDPPSQQSHIILDHPFLTLIRITSQAADESKATVNQARCTKPHVSARSRLIPRPESTLSLCELPKRNRRIARKPRDLHRPFGFVVVTIVILFLVALGRGRKLSARFSSFQW